MRPSNIDEIMLETLQDICTIFNSDRLTIYVLAEGKQSLVSRVKTGLTSFKDMKLPILEQSVAGYVAMTRKAVNITARCQTWLGRRQLSGLDDGDARDAAGSGGPDELSAAADNGLVRLINKIIV